jgi:hypothetical protein
MKYGVVVPLAASAALLALYLNFVVVFIHANLLHGATSLELGIFLLQSFKIGAAAGVKQIRNAPVVNIVDILGAELVVLLPVLVVSNLAFGDASAPGLMVQILLAWIAGVTAFGTPYATYRLARSMIQGGSLMSVLPSAVFLSEVMVLLVAGANSASASGLGLEGLSRAILLVAAGVAAVGAQVAGETALPPLVILYVSLLLYAIAPGDSGQGGRIRSLLAIALLATAVTFGVNYAAAQLSIPLTYVVLPPALVTASLTWWATRES